MSEVSKKYVIFNINQEDYGIPIEKIREVLRYVTITPIHEASEFLKGVINMRGKIIPIIDMRVKFGLEETDYDDRTIFIIVDILGSKEIYNIGITVDAVQDVVDIESKDLEKTPDIGLKLKSQYLEGIAKVEGKMIMILNMDKILTSNEIVDITQVHGDTVEPAQV